MMGLAAVVIVATLLLGAMLVLVSRKLDVLILLQQHQCTASKELVGMARLLIGQAEGSGDPYRTAAAKDAGAAFQPTQDLVGTLPDRPTPSADPKGVAATQKKLYWSGLSGPESLREARRLHGLEP